MVTQYPHSITITVTPALFADESGNLEGGKEVNHLFSCRAEPASGNGIIRTQNGEEVVYTWVVYLPSPGTEFSPGDAVEITLSNGSKYTGTIKRQSDGQLNSRLWV